MSDPYPRTLRLALARAASGKKINHTAQNALLERGAITVTEEGITITTKGLEALKGATK